MTQVWNQQTRRNGVFSVLQRWCKIRAPINTLENMKFNKFTIAFLIGLTSAACFAQDRTNEYVNEKIAQRERALAKAGGDAAMRAAKSGLTKYVAIASSECMESVNTGKQSPHYCLGFEAASHKALNTIPIIPNDEDDQYARAWFGPEKQKNRILAYCIIFLRTTEHRCGDYYASAKMAVQ